jgi:molybdopterin/thiamine biosynthesis adenylyltransferase
MRKYSRQIIEIGEEGQRKLFDSSVLVVGAGGLGCSAIQVLAGAGIGKLGIVDGDAVDITNLHRQTIHAGKIGMNKALSAKQFVNLLNEDVVVEAYNTNLNNDNAEELTSEYDVVLDCTDNFKTRYILNSVCVRQRKPLIHAALMGFEGIVMDILPGGACYQCVHPNPPDEIGEIGVVGATPHILGAIQAVETMKLLLGMGSMLVGRALHIDLLSMEFYEIKVERNPSCPICGDI